MQINLNSGSWELPDGSKTRLDNNGTLVVVEDKDQKLIAAFPLEIVEPGSIPLRVPPKTDL